MNSIILPQSSLDNYELLDSGDGYKLERFGSYTLSRPDPTALWKQHHPELWKTADAIFHKQSGTGSRWQKIRPLPDPWVFSHGPISLHLKLSPFKHTGLFPEQVSNWEWFGKLITQAHRPISVLNLFGYTGGATLWAAAHGAQVTHVDASRPSVQWARENQALSKLTDAPIRWIVDDAKKFVAREARRGVKYDAVIMDPPSFGRDPQGKVFEFEKDVPLLIESVKDILVDKPLFFLLNSYALGYSPTVLRNTLETLFPLSSISCGELHLPEKDSNRTLPCGIVARYSSK